MMVALVGCKNDTFNNSVPRYPVNISIDTRSGVFVHFVPTALNTFVIVNAEGYHYNDEVIPVLSLTRTDTEACWYILTSTVITMLGIWRVRIAQDEEFCILAM